MERFEEYLKTFDIAAEVTDEEVANSVALLQLYSPILRRSARRLGEMEESCRSSRRQSIADFIDLAIDFDHDTDCKRIAERLSSMGHSMELLSILENALALVRCDHRHGEQYYRILQMRYFNVYCHTNEDAFLTLGISSATFYRNIKPAIRLFAANLWCVVIPDLVISARENREYDEREYERRMKDAGIAI